MNFFFWNTMFIFIYIYVELFYSWVFVSIFKNIKFYNLNLLKRVQYINFKNFFFRFFFYILILYFITLKLDYSDNNFIIILLLFLFINIFLSKFIFTNMMFINFNIIFFIIFIFFINSLVLFFIFIELYSIIFYFFFLNISKNEINISLLKFKNNLLLYLINNFFITILFLVGINSVIEVYGSVNFFELQCLNTNTTHWKLYLLLLSFIIKLTLPGFHYLKLEIYKYLNVDTIIIFSVITTFLNYIFILYILNLNFMFYTFISFKILNIMLLLSFFLFIQKLKINNFSEFIAYSGFATNNLVVLNYLV